MLLVKLRALTATSLRAEATDQYRWSPSSYHHLMSGGGAGGGDVQFLRLNVVSSINTSTNVAFCDYITSNNIIIVFYWKLVG